tara:strand:- start:522 stop:2432 length:1911 start_codon:yes stop_codon:yes gene_type:complete
MKNFNLISPKDNGSEYTVRFQDPIVISKNSQIVFNFAELERAGEVVLNEDAHIEIVLDSADLLPRLDPGNGTDENQLFPGSNTKSVPISKGVYSYTQFRDEINHQFTLALQTIVDNYEMKAFNLDSRQATQRDLGFGLSFGNNYDTNFIPSGGSAMAFHNNVDLNDIGEITCNGGVNGTVDAGAMLAEKYLHRYDLDPTHGVDENLPQNFIKIRGVKSTSDQSGHIQFGLYGQEVSQTLGTGANRLFANGVNTALNPVNAVGRGATSGNHYLPVYCGMRVAPYGGNIEFFVGRNTATTGSMANFPSGWQNSIVDIQSVRVIRTIKVSDIFAEDEQPYFLFQTYQNTRGNFEGSVARNLRDCETNWRVIAITGASTEDNSYSLNVIFDSVNHMDKAYLTHKIEVGDDMNYGQGGNEVAKAKSQVPYNPVVGFSDSGDGWSISYARVGIRTGTENHSLILGYKLRFSEELQEVLSADETDFLLPNYVLPTANVLDYNEIASGQFDLFFNTNITNPWKRDSYSIFIDLPCNNYKNLSDKLNGGFRKSVLANIPAPFSSDTVVPATNSNNEITTVYEPYQPIKSDLMNNEISVNSFKITIVDMKTELLAKQLKSSTVNFTILCSDCANNERKQGNSAYNM